jgi:membrane protein, MarC family
MNISNFIDGWLLISTFTTLFVIIDPPGTVPVFLALTAKMDRAAKKRAARVAALTSLAMIIAFALVGRYLLQLLHISFPALQLSGGFLLFLVAMQLLMGKDVADIEADQKINVALVPLGTPLLAGPGAIVAVMIAVDQANGTIQGWAAVLVAVILMHVVIWLTMRFSVTLSRVLGEGGVLLLTRIAGLLLAAIATQMMVEAVYSFIDAYPS